MVFNIKWLELNKKNDQVKTTNKLQKYVMNVGHNEINKLD